MTRLEDDLRGVLRAEADALRVPERPTLDAVLVVHDRHRVARWLVAAACLALLIAGLVVRAQRPAGDHERPPSDTSPVPDTTTPASTPATVTTTSSPTPTTVVSAAAPVANGWVAYEPTDSPGDLVLVRPGEEPRPLRIEGSDLADEGCPVWSPDGTRVMFGRLIGGTESAPASAELVVVPVDVDGVTGTPDVIALDGFAALEGFDARPCAIWASDGRWVALAGTGEVWVVDTVTAEIRRLPNLRPSDLEWRPGTDELAIAGDIGLERGAQTLSAPITVYSVSDDELRPLGATEGAHLTWSPDGSTLAYTGGEDDTRELELVDGDGSDERVLVADTGRNVHGIGPVWSPTGDRIVYQRLCCDRAETHEVVIVDVADGTETVIAPPPSDGPGQDVRWYPFAVTWSPDGRTLLYAAWRSGMPPGDEDGRGHVIAVPLDSPDDVTVLGLGGLGDAYGHGWGVPQSWGRAAG